MIMFCSQKRFLQDKTVYFNKFLQWAHSVSSSIHRNIYEADKMCSFRLELTGAHKALIHILLT